MPGEASAPESVSAETRVLAEGAPAAIAGSTAAATASEIAILGGPASALALALTMFVEAVGYGVVAPTLPFLARAAGAGEAQIGFMVGLYAAVGLLAGIP